MSQMPKCPIWSENGTPHLDVRGLEPPEPMVAILGFLEKPDTGDEVIIVHDRDPIFLYPVLAEEGWSAERLDAHESEIRLRLTRLKDGAKA